MNKGVTIIGVALITALAGAFGIHTTVNALSQSESDSRASEFPAHAAGSHPDRLLLPTLDVSASVIPVGLTSESDMAAPSGYRTAGWYLFSSPPGDEGSTVIAGHLDNGLGLPAVFKDLNKLNRGDPVYVATRSGELLRYAVVATSSHNFRQLPADVFSRVGEPRLVLITCAGEWLPDEQTYSERLLVYAELRSA